MSNSDDDRAFEALLEYLKRSRGFDFSGYKRSSFQRRVQKQMHVREIATFEDYIDYLEVHPEEFISLFNTVLINVTDFFRDAPAWSHLWKQVLPQLLQSKPAHEPLRLWSAGCASGEEAYTLAMILTELLGANEFRQRVKIYATDVDEDALRQARHASYSASDLQALPPGLQDRYFELVADRYIVRADLRRIVIFGRHDLVQDAPISRLDLLVCRNTLMYFNAEAQARILSRLHFALNSTGVLFLGKAEMLLTHTDLFTPTSLPHRIFIKVPKRNLRDRTLETTQTTDKATYGLAASLRLRELAFNATPTSQIVVDREGNLVLANTLARLTFGIKAENIGSPLQDLEVSYRPLELRSHLGQVYADRRTIVVTNIIHSRPDGKEQHLEAEFTLLQDDSILGVSIVFIDVSRYQKLQAELPRSSQKLETANEALPFSNEAVETTNRELQFTNEELETTNEALSPRSRKPRAI